METNLVINILGTNLSDSIISSTLQMKTIIQVKSCQILYVFISRIDPFARHPKAVTSKFLRFSQAFLDEYFYSIVVVTLFSPNNLNFGDIKLIFSRAQHHKKSW